MAGASVSCLVNRFDHLEIAVRDMDKMQDLMERLGFSHTQTRLLSDRSQRLMVQGNIRMVLSEGRPGTFVYEYARKHGEGVCAIAYATDDVERTFDLAVSRGAEVSYAPKIEEGDGMGWHHAAIKSFGDVRATFVKRFGEGVQQFDVEARFAPGFKSTGVDKDKNSVGLLVMDHLTNNVEMGQMDRWADFYKKVYGWEEARYFDIRASQTGLNSKVLQSPDGACKIPVNQATEAKSQVQEFIDLHRGAGVQHIALTTNDICRTVMELNKRGFRFLDLVPSYYEDVRTRFKGIRENLDTLEKLNILVDGDPKNYLLQIFTENQIGPAFFEIIQRRGHNGFGEGNFKALFESIERDQRRRGVL